jgi:flagellar basal-body rod protein FlgF
LSDVMSQVSSSITALTKEFEIITHNLANVSTAGYKRRCNVFTKILESQNPDSKLNTTIDLEDTFDFSQGNLVETGRKLDFAISGKGFFVIETPEGPLYTRNGIFHTSGNGQLIDFSGRMVAGEAGPITIPTTVSTSEISVSPDGQVSAAGAVVGKFRIVDFGDNESLLVPAGSNCYRMDSEEIEPTTAENVVVSQGYQEASNVNTMEELVNMVMVSRLYESNMKVLSAKQEASSSLMSVAMG